MIASKVLYSCLVDITRYRELTSVSSSIPGSGRACHLLASLLWKVRLHVLAH
jgi:hypothetical protein